jgi:hypothetical protein
MAENDGNEPNRGRLWFAGFGFLIAAVVLSLTLARDWVFDHFGLFIAFAIAGAFVWMIVVPLVMLVALAVWSFITDADVRMSVFRGVAVLVAANALVGGVAFGIMWLAAPHHDISCLPDDGTEMDDGGFLRPPHRIVVDPNPPPESARCR